MKSYLIVLIQIALINLSLLSCSNSEKDTVFIKQRGMYLSLDTDHVGDIYFTNETEIFKNVIEDIDKEDYLLSFIREFKFNSITLYNLSSLLSSELKKDKLKAFMIKARRLVNNIEAIGSLSNSNWDEIADFHNNYVKFDSLVTEIEFWNDVTVDVNDLVEILNYMRDLNLKTDQGTPVKITAYLGWFDQKEADAIIPYIDRLYLHFYVKDGNNSYNYGKQRLQYLQNACQSMSKELQLYPIFSAEGEVWSAGEEKFMGEWLKEYGLDEAESTFEIELNTDDTMANITLKGFQYYSYVFLERYLQ